MLLFIANHEKQDCMARQPHKLTRPIGRRIKALRETRGLSQDALARIFGFKDRQTVSAIETGSRQVSAVELVLVSEALETPLEYFTDPFLLAGEGRFSWRQTGVDPASLEVYEGKAGAIVGAYRTLASQVGREPPLMRPTLSLTRRSQVADAQHAGERFAAEFDLGQTPAACLAKAMENQLGIVVLMVDAQPGISGAACRLPELDAVLIAHHELPGRRHFTLAHELFHLLTWEAMPPKHAEDPNELGGNRIERLANAFAAAVLVPSGVMERYSDWSGLSDKALIARLNCVADALQVSSSALRWRLVELGELSSTVAKSLPEPAMHNNGHGANYADSPTLFSRPFLEVIGLALDEGLVSARRATSLLGLETADLANLYPEHGIECPRSLTGVE